MFQYEQKKCLPITKWSFQRNVPLYLLSNNYMSQTHFGECIISGSAPHPLSFLSLPSPPFPAKTTSSAQPTLQAQFTSSPSRGWIWLEHIKKFLLEPHLHLDAGQARQAFANLSFLSLWLPFPWETPSIPCPPSADCYYFPDRLLATTEFTLLRACITFPWLHSTRSILSP